jgi:hypothetical protein
MSTARVSRRFRSRTGRFEPVAGAVSQPTRPVSSPCTQHQPSRRRAPHRTADWQLQGHGTKSKIN